MLPVKKYKLLFILLMAYSQSLTSQMNIKVGYTGGFTKAPVLNKVVDDFNVDFLNKQTEGRLDDQLDRLKSMHGIEVGLRYRINSVGFELSWQSMSDKSDVIGTMSNKALFQDKWFFSLTEYSLGVENYFGNLGYGASLGYRTVRIKTDISGAPRKKRSVTSESGFGSKFYLIFQFPGEKVGIAFKPYVQVPLKNLDISNFDQELNVQLDDSYMAVRPQEERFFMYGLSIVLYNGRQ